MCPIYICVFRLWFCQRGVAGPKRLINLNYTLYIHIYHTLRSLFPSVRSLDFCVCLDFHVSILFHLYSFLTFLFIQFNLSQINNEHNEWKNEVSALGAVFGGMCVSVCVCMRVACVEVWFIQNVLLLGCESRFVIRYGCVCVRVCMRVSCTNVIVVHV